MPWDPGALAGDLAERLVPVELERIPEHRRRGEAEVLAAFEDARPRLLGALLDLLARVLAALPTVHLDRLPRMADFARVLGALDAATGWRSLDAYYRAAADAQEVVVESDPFADAVRRLVLVVRTWEGTAAELLRAVQPAELRPPRGWPTDATRAGAALRRAAEALRASGVEVTFGERNASRSRSRLIRMTAVPRERGGRSASAASAASETPCDQGERADAAADAHPPAPFASAFAPDADSPSDQGSSSPADAADAGDADSPTLSEGACSACGWPLDSLRHLADCADVA